MNGLAIDTSTYVLGIAVIKNDTIVGEFKTHLKKNHSIRLMPAIRTLLDEVEMTAKDLDRIIVAKGPGSYTGVRIGVTTGKTLAWSLGIPVVGVSSLEALAQSGRYFQGYICPFFDARRGQVFTGLYKYINGKIQVVEEDQMALMENLLEELKKREKPVLFLSPDLDVHKQLIQEVLGKNGILGEKTELGVRPGELALLGIGKEAEKNIHDFKPNYLRLAEAEAKWLAANKKAEKNNQGE